MSRIFLTALSLLLAGSVLAAELPPPRAQRAASHAAARYSGAQIALLAELVKFRTVAVEGVPNADNPEFRAFADYIESRAREFGLDFQDFGSVLIVGLGEADRRLGVITHGDVQPADPAKWQKSPFELDTESEPGKLIARGTEDNKAPIATALYAMKTIRELGIPLERRIELWISLTEESDWAPFREVLAQYPPPEINIGIDSDYPVVVAEKGWGKFELGFAAAAEGSATGPRVTRYQGGAFISQVPEDARIEIADAGADLERRLRARAADETGGVQYRISREGDRLVILAKGKAAHSSTPEQGLNALAYAAALLVDEPMLLASPAGRAIDLVNRLLGTDYLARRFGEAAYSHPFMGPLTINLGTARTTARGVTLAFNTRAPAGKSPEALENDLRVAVAGWARDRGVPAPDFTAQLAAAYLPERPPQVEPLLAIFRHYTGIEDARAISNSGGTNARLMPNGVNFGPSMPGVPYTGHSEHEYITREQMALNLKMYAAMLAWLAGAD